MRGAGGTGLRDVEALSRIMVELMQKYTQEDGAIRIEDLERWPSNCDAVEFLSLTTSATSVPTISKAGLRAGNLSLANMIALFAGAHLSLLADLLGFPLNTIRPVHWGGYYRLKNSWIAVLR